MATFSGLNLKQSEVSGILDSALEMIDRYRSEASKTHSRLLGRVHTTSGAEREEYANAAAIHAEYEAKIKMIYLEFIEILKSHEVEVHE